MLTYTVPYDFGKAIFIPSRFMGKVKQVDEYRVVGYEVAENGIFVVLHPKTYEGITSRRRVNDPTLYTTEAEAWADERKCCETCGKAQNGFFTPSRLYCGKDPNQQEEVDRYHVCDEWEKGASE